MMSQEQMDTYAPKYRTIRTNVQTWTGDDSLYHSDWVVQCSRPECSSMIDMVFHDHIVEVNAEGLSLPVCFAHQDA
jgi:hypothetical protein